LVKIGIVFSVIFILSIAVSGQNRQKRGIEQQYEANFQNARHVFHRAYFEKASVLFDKLVAEEPDDPLPYAYAAMVDYMLFRNPEFHIAKAKQLFKEENRINQLARALIYFVEDDLANCELMLKEFLKEYPNDPYAIHVLGFTQTDMGRAQDGLETLTSLIKSQPDYFPAYNHIGYAYLNLGENNMAIEAFQNFLEHDTLNPSAFDSYADGLTSIGEVDRAIAQLTRAVLLEPGFAYGWRHLGEIFQKNGESELAFAAYENARETATFYGARFLKSLEKALNELRK
jgi:predicted Zn-dependent protease